MHYCSTHKQTPPSPSHTHTHTERWMTINTCISVGYIYHCVTHTIHAWAKGNNSNKITVTEQNSFAYLANSLGLWQSLVDTILSYFIKIYIAYPVHIFRKELCKEIMYSIVIYCRIIFNHLVHGVNVRG